MTGFVDTIEQTFTACRERPNTRALVVVPSWSHALAIRRILTLDPDLRLTRTGVNYPNGSDLRICWASGPIESIMGTLQDVAYVAPGVPHAWCEEARHRLRASGVQT